MNARPGSTGGHQFESLSADLEEVFRRGAAIPEERFQQLAGRVFRFQFEANAPYRAFCERRGVRPELDPGWAEFPAVPTRAFRGLELVAGDPGSVQIRFHTSGTTGRKGGYGTHAVRDLDLYHAALDGNFRHHLLPEGGAIRMLSLVPPPESLPHSSLSHMVGYVMRDHGADGSRTVADADTGLDVEGLLEVLTDACGQHRPLMLLGTAFSFVHLTDAMHDGDYRFSLPQGSRVMETGGFKGRSRSMSQRELYDRLDSALGVADPWIVNEYGMTELLSQFYDGVAGSAAPVADADLRRPHRGPPWVRTRVLDPLDLSPATEGAVGVLHHVDLANLGSVASVLTSDLGIRVGDGFRLLGRAPGAEPRGCSIAMDDLLSATGVEFP